MRTTAFMALAVTGVVHPDTMHNVLPLASPRVPPVIACAKDGVAAGDENSDWDADAEWRRWKEEGLLADSSSATAEEERQAQAELWEAELKMLSARALQAAAREDVARAQAQLVEVQEERERISKLGLSVEDVRQIAMTSEFQARALRTAMGVSLFCLLLHTWDMRGAEGVAGCMLTPVVCTMDAVLDTLDQLP
jgi:hypothetical protein